MKALSVMFIALFAMVSSSLLAQTSTQTSKIKVYGECGMCKNRIQKALKVDGITSASWDTETKFLTVSYDASKISNDDIQKKVAAIGHDTEKYRADDKAYNSLPGCCHYERKSADSVQKDSTHH